MSVTKSFPEGYWPAMPFASFAHPEDTIATVDAHQHFVWFELNRFVFVFRGVPR